MANPDFRDIGGVQGLQVKSKSRKGKGWTPADPPTCSVPGHSLAVVFTETQDIGVILLSLPPSYRWETEAQREGLHTVVGKVMDLRNVYSLVPGTCESLPERAKGL